MPRHKSFSAARPSHTPFSFPPPLAVATDGYGVSYMVSGEGEFFFHVSSRVSAPNTDSARFLGRIYEALREMKGVLLAAVEAEEAGRASSKAAGAAAGGGGSGSSSRRALSGTSAVPVTAPTSAASAAAAATVHPPPVPALLPGHGLHRHGVSFSFGTPALGPEASPALIPTPLTEATASEAGDDAASLGAAAATGVADEPQPASTLSSSETPSSPPAAVPGLTLIRNNSSSGRVHVT